MANPKALVDGVIGLSEQPESLAATPGKASSLFVTVRFLGGQSGKLDMSAPRSKVWAEVLDSLRQENLPAYVEIDPVSNLITELLCPLTVHVGNITPTGEGDDVEVELIISHAKNYLRSTHPDFKELLDLLKTAQEKKTKVLVTTQDENEIVDVRPIAELEAGGQE